MCGLIAQYNATGPQEGPDLMPWLLGQILRKQLIFRGFIIFNDFGALYPEFAAAMGEWIAKGQVHYREDMVDGLENALTAFVGLLRGENFGKRVIRVG